MVYIAIVTVSTNVDRMFAGLNGNNRRKKTRYVLSVLVKSGCSSRRIKVD